MATNFPGSLDSFTNPSSSSTLDSPSHAAQHANINDAVEAVQAKLGTGSGTIGEWQTWTPNVRPNTGSFTTVSVVRAVYSQVNNIVFATLNYQVTNFGTGGGYTLFDLPVTASSQSGAVHIGNGREWAVNGYSVLCVRNNIAEGRIYFYDGSATADSNYSFSVTLTYEVT